MYVQCYSIHSGIFALGIVILYMYLLRSMKVLKESEERGERDRVTDTKFVCIHICSAAHAVHAQQLQHSTAGIILYRPSTSPTWGS